LDFVSEVVGSATEEIGSIVTSDKLINKLISNTLWGQRSNYLSVPTDCPQRDERYGWTGDAQAFSITAAYNADVDGFFHKWMQDARDSQSDEGAYPDVIPRSACCSSENAAAWSDAGIIVPYNIYMMYNDVKIIEDHYASMEKYIAQLITNFGMSGPIPRYGDWLAYDYCKNEYLSSAYFIYDIDLMTKMSEVIGKSDRAEYYKDLRKQAHAYFVENFMKDGKLIGQTQTDKIIAMAFNLVDEDYARELADELVKQIKANDNRLSSGFVGTCKICPTLSKYGKDNMAYTLLMQRKEPSWLYSVDQGATTIWERWNSYTKENGFGDVGMNSFNHYAYGSVVEWMYRYMAGIEPGKPGFEEIILQPRVDTRTANELPDGQQRMTDVKASYKSAAGLIESEWHNADSFTYRCNIPVTAELRLPIFGDKLTVNGVEHSFDEYENENGCAIIRLAPGEYVFEEM
ncbi:MAG: alpha-L-rhamnosidase C-terminal domain-containing protein, partial [Oscillospiraceae bacterium]|nr:alpha-L-rhamnosidase C-terminal domain-containing protein [Oscillospiraceae bacterium]